MPRIILFFFFTLTVLNVFSQKKKQNAVAADTTAKEIFSHNDELRGRNEMRIMFYNVENLFDTINDPDKNDEDFLPDGNHHWNSWRYSQKLKNIYKVATAVGGWEPPDVIGVCEIENLLVLEQLIRWTPLKNFNYEIVHFESPDNRGIDVGLLYRPDKFQPLTEEAINVNFEDNPDFKTRDILYIKALVFGKDTLHLFVNHWPSRYGGAVESEPKRILAAATARKKIDEILTSNPSANILLMGDLNDYPEDISISESLKAKGKLSELKRGELFNLMYDKAAKHEGSHKYQSHWGALDQMIVSPNMLDEKNELRVKNNNAFIYRNPFLMKDDERWMGTKPNRTYEGFKYTGGFSDHLPIFLDLLFDPR
jgi:predicted extracellular nuclease